MVGIKDFDIPKNCKECIFKIENRCLIINRSSFNAIYHDIKRKDCPLIEAIPKADHENRLKADLVAMLEDLDLQIDELAAYNLEVAKVQRLIRDRIDKLKENKE